MFTLDQMASLAVVPGHELAPLGDRICRRILGRLVLLARLGEPSLDEQLGQKRIEAKRPEEALFLAAYKRNADRLDSDQLELLLQVVEDTKV